LTVMAEWPRWPNISARVQKGWPERRIMWQAMPELWDSRGLGKHDQVGSNNQPTRKGGDRDYQGCS